MRPQKLLLLVAAVAGQAAAKDGRNVQYSNHLFNAVHGAMRQWDSSLNHNGMTAFVATVPADTEFYHGTGSEHRINGTQWLAFEPEHALLFAHHGPPGGKPGKRPPGPPSKRPPVNDKDGAHEEGAQHGRPGKREGRSPHAADQLVMGAKTKGPYKPSTPPAHGYLHTYRTKHALRLLYVDGQSAAKSDKGTLDLQDVVILRGQLPTGEGQGRSGPMHEYERANGLCKRANNEWEGKIDGILRMEGGFEIILCSFEDHLNVVSIEQVQDREPRLLSGDHNLLARREPDGNMINYYKAIASRYDGVGGDRVQVDFDRAVSLYSYKDALSFEGAWPRARNDTKSVQQARDDIDSMARTFENSTGTNWQAIADMIVARWADRLVSLSHAKTLTEMKEQLTLGLAPYINYADRDSTREMERCASQYLPDHAFESGWRRKVGDGMISMHHALSPAGEAVSSVSMSICREMTTLATGHDLHAMVKSVDSLRDWLGWATWKRCRGCAANEVCFVPIWPAGSIKDFEHPRCKSLLTWGRDSGDYWRDEGYP